MPFLYGKLSLAHGSTVEAADFRVTDVYLNLLSRMLKPESPAQNSRNVTL